MGKSALANTCEGHEMPCEADTSAWGSLFGKSWNQYQYKGKAQKSKQYKRKWGESRTVSAKKRGNSTHTHSAEGENYEGKISNPAKHHTVRLETRTQRQDAKRLCAPILTRFGFPFLIWKSKPNVSSKVYITTRPAKHIHPEKAENKSSKSSLGSVKAATIAVTVVTPWHSSMFSLRRRSRRTPRNGRSFPPSESSQRSIKR